MARYGYWSSLAKAGRAAEAAAGFEELAADAASGAGRGPLARAADRARRWRARCSTAGAPAEALPLATAAEARLRALFGADHHRAQGARAVLDAAVAANGGG